MFHHQFNFHTIKSILNLENSTEPTVNLPNFHTIKSILNLVSEQPTLLRKVHFHTIKSILNNCRGRINRFGL